MTTVGEGFGRTYSPPVNVEDVSNSVRREKTIITMINGAKVKVTLRDTIVSWDPYLNLIKASAYPWIVAQNGGGKPYFPVPPVSRRIKDALIRTTVEI